MPAAMSSRVAEVAPALRSRGTSASAPPSRWISGLMLPEMPCTACCRNGEAEREHGHGVLASKFAAVLWKKPQVHQTMERYTAIVWLISSIKSMS